MLKKKKRALGWQPKNAGVKVDQKHIFWDGKQKTRGNVTNNFFWDGYPKNEFIIQRNMT